MVLSITGKSGQEVVMDNNRVDCRCRRYKGACPFGVPWASSRVWSEYLWNPVVNIVSWATLRSSEWARLLGLSRRVLIMSVYYLLLRLALSSCTIKLLLAVTIRVLTLSCVASLVDISRVYGVPMWVFYGVRMIRC